MTDDQADPVGAQLVRRRAAWVLVVGALIAVIVVSAAVLFTGTPGDSPVAGGPAGPSSTAPSAAPSPTPSASPTAHRRLPGDDGNLLRALNAYRTTHHRRAVTATVSPAAQLCASSGGAENRCPTPYYWEPVEAADGRLVIHKITADRSGVQWLLDPAMSSVQIGWARGTDGLHLCALIKKT